MYIPKEFNLDDPARIAAVIEQFNFGVLVSALPGQAPVATHLPFMYDAARGQSGTLIAHMARANPHWKDFAALADAGAEALIVFSGPHGFISPSSYGPGDAVPTWNYVAVHAYGTPKVMDDLAVRPMLEEMVAAHETGSAPWTLAGNDEGFMTRMQRGIVAFEIPIARIEAKAKLSQNKTPEIRSRVAAAMRAQGGDGAVLAAWMDQIAPSG